MARSKNDINLASLLKALRDGSPGKLEALAADLLGRLLKVRVSLAKSGFQHGGDAGTAGRAGRHLRIECKRYADNTPLSERELQGEIDDAMRRNPGLEAWILVSTRRASENTQEVLNLKAREVGVPIIVIDWAAPEGVLPDLAGLCAWAPDLVESHYGPRAAKSAASLSSFAEPVVDRIRRELDPWRIGYKQLRRTAQARVRRIWGSEIESRAAFAQNAAGGAARHLVSRGAVLQALNAWWRSAGTAPAVVYGGEGVGKTWAVLQWLLRELRRMPIPLTLPSSAFLDVKTHTESGVIEFLSGVLYETTGSQDRRFWHERLRKILQAPSGEGPALLLLIDGMNQEPSFDWRRLIQVLQGGCFRGRVRFILTTQTHFLEERLQGLRLVSGGLTRIGVEPYDAEQGGELEQLLAQHGRTLASVPSELLDLARVPRLFPIVMRLGADVVMEGDATTSRLLWAHGRDELSLREGRAFSESEWEQWLLQLAASHWAAIQSDASLVGTGRTYTLAELDEMVARHSLEPALNYRRLQEIIDGTWMEAVPGKPGVFRPRASTIHLALGAAVLRFLEDAERVAPASVEMTLARWLDPVAATSAAADILAAAMSVAVAKGLPTTSAISGAIVTALLQSQNAQDAHRRQVMALAPVIFRPLLDAVERSSSRANASARHWALSSLRGVSSENVSAWVAIHKRLVSWVAHVPCPTADEIARDDGPGKHQAARLLEKIGVDQVGVHLVMGVPIRLHAWEQEDLAESIPGLLIGKPLLSAMPVFAAAAVAAAIHHSSRSWDGLKWLVTLNPVDAGETVAQLERLSTAALEVPGGERVNPEFPLRVAALILWLAGGDDDERKASTMQVSFESRLNYDEDYLANPTRSFFGGLERRHLDLLWGDEGIALLRRIQTAKPYLPDPAVRASDRFVRAIEAAAMQFDTARLDTNLSVTGEDHALSELKPGAARLAPSALAGLVRRWFEGLPARTGELRHWAGLRAPRYLLLANAAAAVAARELRLNQPPTPDREEPFLATRLLEIELVSASVDEQLDALVLAPEAHLTLELLSILREPAERVLERFLDRWGSKNRRAVEVAFNYLATHSVQISALAFESLCPFALPGSDAKLRIVAFIGLENSAPVQFGQFLVDRNWKVESSQTTFEQEHGSQAVLAALSSTSLERLQRVVAPWCLLTEARRRGAHRDDAKLAAAALNESVNADAEEVEHGEVAISVDLTRRPGRISFDPPEQSTGNDEMSFRESLDSDAQTRRQEKARASGDRFLSRAQDAGAVMAARTVDVEDARMLVATCTAEVELWLDGYEERTPAFRKRLNAAGGLFVALCEALLDTDWKRGVQLWFALDECLHMNFVGLGGVNDLFHMPFRVPANPGVLALRREVYSLARNTKDKSYVDIFICAISNNQLPWLQATIAEDAASSIGWRQKRAIMMSGLIASGSVTSPVWPVGPSIGTWGWLRRRAQEWTNRQAFSQHWWVVFLEAKDAETAYAAWQVFLLCADRRVLTWLKSETAKHEQSDELWRLKMLHVEVNWSELESAMREKESKGTGSMDQHLLGWDAPEEWFEPDQLTLVEKRPSLFASADC